MDSKTYQKISKLAPDLPYFKGHFPQFPVVPAVAFFNLSQSYIEEWQLKKLSLVQAQSWRFKKSLTPNCPFIFEAELIEKTKPIYQVRWLTADEKKETIAVGLLQFLS